MLMKTLRVFLNIIFAMVMSVGILFVNVGVYALAAAQSPSVSAIHVGKVNDDDSVSMWDAFGFWGTDVAVGTKCEPKYRIRNWFYKWDGWQNGMGWADSALDFVISVGKPIVAPIAQVNALKEYHGRDISDFLVKEDLEDLYESYTFKTGERLSNEEVMERYVYELLVEYCPSLITQNDALSQDEKEALFIEFVAGYESNSEKIVSIATQKEIDDLRIENIELLTDTEIDAAYAAYATRTDDTGNGYMKWVKKNGGLYNHIWKLEKYNHSEYNIYFSKFIDIDEHGTRTIKTPVVVLYYCFTVSIVLGIAFVCAYPIGLIQAKFVGKKEKTF